MTRDCKRFAQLVRKLVREHVRAEREAPGLTLWVSAAGDPRAAAAVRIGAAQDVADVRYLGVSAIEDAGAHYAAIGRLQLQGEDELQPTSIFGLIVFERGAVVPAAAWTVDIVAGRIGAWLPWEMSPASVYEPFAFAQAALDRVAKREREGEDATTWADMSTEERLALVGESLKPGERVAVMRRVEEHFRGARARLLDDLEYATNVVLREAWREEHGNTDEWDRVARKAGVVIS